MDFVVYVPIKTDVRKLQIEVSLKFNDNVYGIVIIENLKSYFSNNSLRAKAVLTNRSCIPAS